MKYLLDTNVLKEISRPKPHENVAAWLETIDDIDLAISVLSVREISKGIAKKRQKDQAIADVIAAGAAGIFAAYSGRILSVDEAVARCWGEALGHVDNHVDDTGLAATAKVNNLIVVTRNIADFERLGVTLLDPFKKNPKPIPPTP